MTIGEEIKRLRKEKKLTLLELSKKTGLSNACICQIENDKHRPTAETINTIYEALGISKLYALKQLGLLDETDILTLIDENKRLREALAFYEKVSNYEPWRDEDQVRSDAFNLIDLDQGETARKALEGGSNNDRRNL